MEWIGRIQSTGLEKIIVIFGPRFLSVLWREPITRLAKAAILIDSGKLLNNIVVESFPQS